MVTNDDIVVKDDGFVYVKGEDGCLLRLDGTVIKDGRKFVRGHGGSLIPTYTHFCPDDNCGAGWPDGAATRKCPKCGFVRPLYHDHDLTAVREALEGALANLKSGVDDALLDKLVNAFVLVGGDVDHQPRPANPARSVDQRLAELEAKLRTLELERADPPTIDCTNCGTIVDVDARLCPACGQFPHPWDPANLSSENEI
jgi:predicted  nucleic acid-binding Zn-ribbon protein